MHIPLIRNFTGVLVGVLFVAATMVTARAANAPKPTARADVHDAAGKNLGQAQFFEKKGVLEIKLDLTGLPPGSHAIHLHEKGVCQGPDFETAGGHFNPEGKAHGAKNESGAHAGDLPNVEVGETGALKTTLVAKNVSVKGGKTPLLGTAGASIVIHEKPDDLKSDPAGDSGSRIACGVIMK